MLDRNGLLSLMRTVAKANPMAEVAYSFNNESFSYETLNETLRQELNEYAGSYASFRENKNLIFSLVEETLTEVLPKKVMDQYGQFAEVRTFNQGDRPIFKIKIGRERAKQFVTKVGLAGVYETFKLSEKAFEVSTTAYGGAARLGLEEMLDGRFNMAELIDIIMEGLDEAVYKEIADALANAVTNLPAYQKATGNGFDEDEMDHLLSVASAFGIPTIYCTYEFATKMIPSSEWSDNMKDTYWNNGYFTTYKGHRVVILPQSYTIDNKGVATPVINSKVAYILTGDAKPVKVAFEGDTLVREVENHDWSKEIQVYKKFGVSVITNSNIFVYTDTSVAQ